MTALAMFCIAPIILLGTWGGLWIHYLVKKVSR